MNRNRVATLVAGTTASAALLIGAAAASAQQQSTTHTLTFRSHQISSSQVGKNVELESDRDLRSGHTIGYDGISCHFDFKAKVARCRVALALANGTMAGRFTVGGNNGTVRGTIVSGTGAYAGVTGTINGRPTSNPKNTTITLRYHH